MPYNRLRRAAFSGRYTERRFRGSRDGAFHFRLEPPDGAARTCASGWSFTPRAWCRRCAISSTARRVKEAAIISTCNRTEVYCNTDEPREAVSWLADYHRMKPRELEPYLYHFPQEQAVKHAFRVASGLDSMVLGEPQILGQFKEAVKQRGGRGHARARAQQAFPAHVLGRENGAHRNRDRREHGVDGLRGGAARRAHLPDDRGAERALRRRGRDDRALRRAFRRAAPEAHDVREPHRSARRSSSPTASSAASFR